MRSGPAPHTAGKAAHNTTSASVVVPLRAAPAAALGDATWADQVKVTYLEVRAPLWRALVAWSANPDVADEAVAEAFAQLLRRGDEVLDPASWVWRAAFRLAAGDLKRRGTSDRRRATDPDLIDLVADVDDRLPEDALDLVAALGQLSDQQRQCVALVDIAGHTAPSAAEILGTSAATVRVQLMRARRQLRTLLTDPSQDAGAAAGPDDDPRSELTS